MSRISLAAIVLAGSLWLSAGTAFGQDNKSAELRRAEGDYATLRIKLDTLNSDIATLKRSNRSVRDDYRLRDRQAEAESVAQQVTKVESRIRALGGHVPGETVSSLPMEPPHATGEENRFESEAKADLLADQSNRLMREADRLQKASVELRSRQTMRRQAGKWDRDPFAGMESSKRNLPISVAAKSTLDTPNTGTRGPTLTAGGTATNSDTTQKGTTISAPGITTGTATSPTTTPTYSAESSSAGAKTSPTPLSSTASDRLEQRVFLDPATAAQLRMTLGNEAALSDPDALVRAAELLRARARALANAEKSLRQRGQP